MVYEGGRRSPAIVFNEKVMCGLGARLATTGKLDPKGRERAVAAIRRFAAIASYLNVGALAAVATAAVRDSKDGAAFCAEVEAVTGVRPMVTSGADEARFAALGVLFGEPGAEGVVVDLGGASMEFCRVGGGKPGRGVTTPLGPLRVKGKAHQNTFEAEITACLKDLVGDFRLDGGRLYLVGGSWRALARAHIERIDYPIRVLHEYVLTVKEALKLADWAAVTDPAEIAALPGVPTGRAALMPQVGVLLRHLVTALKPGDIMVSGFGLREGVCLEHMPPTVRRRDPLISACDAQEAIRSRNPGFGAELAAWAKTAIPPADASVDRLIEAAARLVDVNWRNHPDYRIAGAWETVTRTTITDLGHEGRAFIGAILGTRYKASRKMLEQARMTEILDRRTVDRAIRYGLTFRLGAALAGSTPGVLPLCRVVQVPGSLELVLEGDVADLAGEEIDKRFKKLIAALGVTGKISVIPEQYSENLI